MKKGAKKTPFWKEAGLFVLDILYNAVVIIILVVLIRSFLISPFRVIGSSMADTLYSKEFIIVNKLVYLISDPERGDIIVFRPPITSKYDPKFEKEIKTDAQGNVLLQIDNLETEKDAFYCKPPLISSLWFCQDKVKTGDVVYYYEKTGLSSFSDPGESRKKIVSGAEYEKKEIRFTGKPETLYKVSIYNEEGPEFFIKRVIGLPGDTIKISDGKVFYKEKGWIDFMELEEGYLNAQNENHTYLQQDKQEEIFTIPEGEYFVLGDNRNFSNDSRSWTAPVDRSPAPFVKKADISGKAMLVLWPLHEIKWIRHQ